MLSRDWQLKSQRTTSTCKAFPQSNSNAKNTLPSQTVCSAPSTIFSQAGSQGKGSLIPRVNSNRNCPSSPKCTWAALSCELGKAQANGHEWLLKGKALPKPLYTLQGVNDLFAYVSACLMQTIMLLMIQSLVSSKYSPCLFFKNRNMPAVTWQLMKIYGNRFSVSPNTESFYKNKKQQAADEILYQFWPIGIV